MSTTVTYKGSTLTTVDNQTRTLETAGTYLEDDITLVDVSQSAPVLQAKTNIAPTTSSQTITPDSGYDGLSSVQINAIPTGSAGTPTATKGTVSNHAVSVTPSVTNTAGYITGGTKTGTAVSVSASELVSGTKSITANGSNIDVANYKYANVSVSTSFLTKTVTNDIYATTTKAITFSNVTNEPSSISFVISITDISSLSRTCVLSATIYKGANGWYGLFLDGNPNTGRVSFGSWSNTVSVSYDSTNETVTITLGQYVSANFATDIPYARFIYQYS